MQISLLVSRWVEHWVQVAKFNYDIHTVLGFAFIILGYYVMKT